MSLLFKFRPLVINPQLAKRIGLNEAIVLQQVSYWLNETESGIEHDGRRWIYNTYEQWIEQFPFWSQDTVKRAITSLKKQGVLIVEKLSSDRLNHTNYYTINYDAAALIEECKMHQSESAKCTEHDEGKMHQSNGADCPDVTYTNNTYTTQKTTTETTTGELENLPAVLPKQKRKKQDDNAVLGDLPDWIPVEPWIGFVEMRKAMGAKGKLTEHAVKLLVADLKKLKEQGQDLTEVINRSIMNNWKGFFAVKQQYAGRQQALEDRNRAAAEQFANGSDW